MHIVPAAPTISIVVVDDHPLASTGVAKFLKREPDMAVVAVCLNAAESVDAIRRLEPAIVVFEFSASYPAGSGLLRAAGNANPDARAIIVSRHLAELESFRASGASGFVLTEQASLHLAACVRNVHTGATWIEYLGRVKRLTTPTGSMLPVSG